jgi:hypothetical protein
MNGRRKQQAEGCSTNAWSSIAGTYCSPKIMSLILNIR